MIEASEIYVCCLALLTPFGKVKRIDHTQIFLLLHYVGCWRHQRWL